MDEFEAPARLLPVQGCFTDDERRWKLRETLFDFYRPWRRLLFLQRSRKRQMKTELVHHIRAPSSARRRFLRPLRSRLPAPRELTLFIRRVKFVQSADASFRRTPQISAVSAWRQRWNAAERRQLQPVAMGGREHSSQSRDGAFARLWTTPCEKVGKRLQRSLSLIVSGRRCDVIRTGRIEMRRGLAGRDAPDIPAEPRCAEIRRRAVGGRTIGSKPRVRDEVSFRRAFHDRRS